MLNLNYGKETVVALFMQQVGTPNPTSGDIAGFDGNLFRTFDADLVSIMSETVFALPVDKRTRSHILLISQLASGNTRQKIRKACRLFQAVAGL